MRCREEVVDVLVKDFEVQRQRREVVENLVAGGGSERLTVSELMSDEVLAWKVCLKTRQRDRCLPYIARSKTYCLVSIVVDAAARCCLVRTKTLLRVFFDSKHNLREIGSDKRAFVPQETVVNFDAGRSVICIMTLIHVTAYLG